MATTYPQGSFRPAIFSDSSPDTTQASLGLHTNALYFQDFTADAAAATTLFLTFVIFNYPNANNASGTPPNPPVVEMLMAPASGPPPNFNAAGIALAQTAMTGTQALPIPGGSVNYTYLSLGGGVFQVKFTTDNVAFSSLQWHIRFTITDGATNATNQKGLTLVVDGDAANTTSPWLAVPGQLNLAPTGPVPLDFGTALQGLTVSGPSTSTAKQLIANQTYNLLIPVGNYGTAPLSISAVNPSAATNGFTLQLLSPLTIPPGSTDAVTLQASFLAPAAGQTGSAAQATKFTLTSNDPLASGAATHFNTVSLYATTVPLPSVVVSRTSVDFGNVPVNGASNTLVTVTNSSANPVTVAISLTPVIGLTPGDFWQRTSCPVSPATLAAGTACTIDVSFRPTQPGFQQARITVTPTPGSPVMIPLTGTGLAAPLPSVVVSPPSIDFGNVPEDSLSNKFVTVTNSSANPVTVAISLAPVIGLTPGDFVQRTDCPVSPATLAAGAACTIHVGFRPARLGFQQARITVTPTPGIPVMIPLEGRGLAALDEDCLPVHPRAVQVQQVAGRWKVVDGNNYVLDFDTSQANAERAKAVIVHYGFDRFCFVGRPNAPMSYFTVGGEAPSGAMPGEDAIAFDLAAVVTQQVAGNWIVTDGRSSMLNFGTSEANAVHAVTIIKRYGFTHLCFVGRPNPNMMMYFRK